MSILQNALMLSHKYIEKAASAGDIVIDATCGNGLGLALVKRVMDIVHGEISVESALGEGSTFIVKIRR